MKYLIIFIIGFAVLVPQVEAARIFIDEEQVVAAVSQEVLITAYIDTKDESMNVVAGTLLIPGDLNIKEIRYGDAAVSFWIEPPTYSSLRKEIKFAGMIPGGLNSSRAKLFTISLYSKIPQITALDFTDVSVLINNGLATPAPVEISTPELVFVNQSFKDEASVIPDYDPPEVFLSEILVDNNINNGAKTLIWTASDKSGSNVKSYIKEGWWNRYKEATSPYQLSNQSYDRTIYLRVYDEAGNYATVVMPGDGNKNYFYLNWILLVLLIVVALLYLHKRYKKQ